MAYEQRCGITLDQVPYPSEDDRLDGEDVRVIVFYYARTGNYAVAADQSGFCEGEVRNCLRRRAAQEIIAFMVEEETWPEGQSVGRWA